MLGKVDQDKFEWLKSWKVDSIDMILSDLIEEVLSDRERLYLLVIFLADCRGEDVAKALTSMLLSRVWIVEKNLVEELKQRESGGSTKIRIDQLDTDPPSGFKKETVLIVADMRRCLGLGESHAKDKV